MHRLRWVYGLFAAVLIAILGYTAFWFFLKRQVERGLADWAAMQRQIGWQVAYAPPQVSGYPYRLVIAVRDIAMGDPGHAQAWALRLPSIRAITHPWTLRHLILEQEGELELSWGPATARAELRANGDAVRASLVLDSRDRLQRLAVEGRNGALDVRFPRFDGRFTARAEHAELHLRDNRARQASGGTVSSADLAVSLDNLTSSMIRPSPPFGPTIASVGLDLGVTGRIDAPSVAAWRDDGGTVELRRAALRWGPLDASATGTLAVDNQMRPIGALTAEAKGWEAVIDKLVDMRQIARGQARGLKLALGLLSKPTADGGKVLSAPIALQNGKLMVGPAAVMDLPVLGLE